MLVLQRKPLEEIVIQLEDGTIIKLVLLGFKGDYVKLGFDAPLSIQIDRKEIYLEKLKSKNITL